MKNSKKIVALVLAMVMIFALTASALAAIDSTNAVTVTVQIYKRSSSGMTGFGSRSVTLTGSNPTVYDAVQTISNDASYTKLRNAAWIYVAITDANGTATNEIGKALVYLTAERSSYNSQYVLTTVTENLGSNGSTVATPRSDGGTDYTYTGTDWIFQVNNVDGTDYMNRTTVQNGDVITLFFQTSTMSWPSSN